eukprot:g81679.t1
MELYSVIMGEVQRNMMVLRRNSRWRTQPLQIAEEKPSLMDALRSVRRELAPSEVLSDAWIPRIIALFANVVTSPETSGSVTAISLASLRKLLLHGLLNREGPGAAEGMRLVVLAVTQCRFEATDSQRDEIVLSTLLQIQTMLFELPAARYLSDHEVWEIVRTAFRIYDSMKPPEYSDLLQANAITVLQTMITLIFLRHALDDSHVQAALTAARFERYVTLCYVMFCYVRLHDSDVQVALTGANGAAVPPRPERFGNFRRGGTAYSSGRFGLPAMTKVLQHLCLLGHSATSTAECASALQSPLPRGFPSIKSSEHTPLRRSSSAPPLSPDASEASVVSVEGQADNRAANAAEDTASERIVDAGSDLALSAHTHVEGIPDTPLQPGLRSAYSPVSCAHSASFADPSDLSYVDLSLSICKTPAERYGRAVFVCRLLSSVLQAGGSELISSPPLLELFQEQVFRFLFDICTWQHPIVLSAALQLFTELVCAIRVQIPLQIELMLSRVYLPAISKGSNFELQEVIFESVLDLVRHHWFLPELYANFDCNIEAQNVFSLLLNATCKSAFPVSGVLTTNHALGLRCLISAFHSMVHISSAPPLNAFEAANKVTRPGPYLAVRSGSELRQAQNYKSTLAFCVDEFNRSPKRGLLLLQDRLGLFTTFPRFKSERLHKDRPARALTLDEQRDMQEMGRFLRYTPGLDQDQIGLFLSTQDVLAFHIRKAYFSHFHFEGMSLPDGLRILVAACGLPKEAQMIDRVLASFAHRFHENNPTMLASEDACHTLVFSLLLLNTDRYNSQIKKKMTLEQFISNNRGINDGEDVPRDLLISLFEEITTHELKMTATHESHLSDPVWSDYMHISRRRTRTRPYTCLSTYSEEEKDATFNILQEAELLTFQAIWRPVLGTFSMAFDLLPEEDVKRFPSSSSSSSNGAALAEHDSDNDHLLLKLLREGFGLICAISRRYGQTQIINRVVGALCKFVSQTGDSSLYDTEHDPEQAVSAEFANRAKQQFALRLVFSLVVDYKDLLRAGWKDVVSALLQLQRLNLLPLEWLELSDAKQALSQTRRTQLFPMARESMESFKRNSGMASWVGFGFLVADSGMDEDEASHARTLKSREAMAVCLRPLTELLITHKRPGLHELNTESLQSLVAALVEHITWKGPRKADSSASKSGQVSSPLLVDSSRLRVRPLLPEIDMDSIPCLLSLEWLNKVLTVNTQQLGELWPHVKPALAYLCEMAVPSPSLFHLEPVSSLQQSLQNSPLALPHAVAEGTAVLLLSVLELLMAEPDGWAEQAVHILKLVLHLDVAQPSTGIQVSEWLLNFCQRASAVKRGSLVAAQTASPSPRKHSFEPVRKRSQGARDVPQISEACLEDVRIWRAVLVLLARCTSESHAFSTALKALHLMLGRLSDTVLCADTLCLAQATVLTFASSPVCGPQEALECVDLLLALATHVSSQITRSPALVRDLKPFYLHPDGLVGPFEHYKPPFPFSPALCSSSFCCEPWQQLCLPILTDFRSLCVLFGLRQGWEEVFHHAVVAFQQLMISDCMPLAVAAYTEHTALATNRHNASSAMLQKSTAYGKCWQSCMAEAIMPLMQDLQPGGNVTGLPPSNALEQTRAKLIEFASRVFSQRLPQLRACLNFHLLWLGYLNLTQAYIRYSEDKGLVCITTRRHLKQVVEAMYDARVFADSASSSGSSEDMDKVCIGRELWDLTWSSLDVELSQLREEAFPSPFASEASTKRLTPSELSVAPQPPQQTTHTRPAEEKHATTAEPPGAPEEQFTLPPPPLPPPSSPPKHPTVMSTTSSASPVLLPPPPEAFPASGVSSAPVDLLPPPAETPVAARTIQQQPPAQQQVHATPTSGSWLRLVSETVAVNTTISCQDSETVITLPPFMILLRVLPK